MNHTNLIKRAWQITWRHRVLWIFGILLALTSGGSGGGGGGGNASQMGGANGMPPIPGFENLDGFDLSRLVGFAALCCCLLLIWAIVATIVKYVARTALYRSVDQIEATEAAPTWRAGFRLGWSNRAFRLWLLDLIIGIPFAIAALLLLALGASPLLLLLVDSPAARGIGIAMTIGLELLIIMALIVAGVALSVLGQFWSREIAIADRGIGQAFAAGYRMVRSRLKDVGVMWLLLLAIGLGFGLLMVPVAMLVIFLALAVGGGLGFALHALTDSVPLAFAVGLPPFLLITIVPLTIIQGIYEVFNSGAWTLTYREVAADTPDA